MPPLITQAFDDPDAYRSTVLEATGSLTMTGRGVFRAELDRHVFGEMLLLHGRTNVGHVTRKPSVGRTHFAFMPGASSQQVWLGRTLRSGQLLSPPNDGELIIQVPEAAEWATFGWPSDVLSRRSLAVAGQDLAAGRQTRQFQAASPLVFNRLRWLHATSRQLAARAGRDISPAVIRRFSDAFVRALVACLPHDGLQEDRSARRRHAQIVRRLHDTLDANPQEPIELGDLCDTIGVTLRTLHVACQDILAMSSGRYLRLHRMNLTHRALRTATPHTGTVTQIASHFGFWELGRFAAHYREQFGESPSETLRR